MKSNSQNQAFPLWINDQCDIYQVVALFTRGYLYYFLSKKTLHAGPFDVAKKPHE